MANLSNLQAVLVNSKLQKDNNALYQVITQLIASAVSIENLISSTDTNTILQSVLTYGTAAQRTNFKPNAPQNVLIIYFETDTSALFTYTPTTGWVSTVGGITQLTGDVVAGPGTGSVASTISNNAVTYGKIQTVTGSRLLGRATSTTGTVEEISLGAGLSFSGTTLQNNNKLTIGITIDGGGVPITTGIKGYYQVANAGTIERYTVLSVDAASIVGNINIDVKKMDFSGFTSGAVTISGTTGPFLTATNKNSSTALTGWTTTFSALDIFSLNVTTVATVTKVLVQLVAIQ